MPDVGDFILDFFRGLSRKEVADFVAKRAHVAISAVSKEIMTDEERVVFYSILDNVYKNITKIDTEGIPSEE